jgi:amicyanin
VSVSIKNMSFSPGSVSIKVGDTVTWTNRDDQDHTVAARDGSFSSGNMKSGESFSYKFTKAGTFSYGCSLHPRMKGSVVVADAPK